MSMTGNWELTVDSPMGKQVLAMQLGCDGENVTELEVVSPQGTAKIMSSEIEGNTLTFAALLPANPMKATLTLTFDGDSADGDAKLIIGSFPVTGKRLP